MLTLPSSLAPLFLRLTRANRTYATAAGARKAIREAELRPSTFGPPAHLRPGVRIDVRRVNGMPVYTITPTRSGSRGAVVYLHGGGWVHEIAVQHWMLAAQIADEAGTTVTLPIYPLVPVGTAGEVVDATVELVRENLRLHGPTALAGDSAGGQIALSAALALRDRHDVTLPATVLISPALDLTLKNPHIPAVQPSDPWLGTVGARVIAEQWRGELDINDPIVSPLNGDFEGLGPVTVFSGTRDILNPDAHLLVRALRDANTAVRFHEGAKQLHVYPLLPTMPGREARRTIVGTLREALAER